MGIIDKILIRADAANKIGTGHVMRCFSLAQGIKDAGTQVAFLCFEIPDKLEKLLQNEKIELIKVSGLIIGSKEDARLTYDYAKRLGADWIIADGYRFGGDYQRFIKEQGKRLLVLDDYGHSDFYYADIILNTGLDSYDNMYSNREAYTCLLTGPKYISLRREFLNKEREKREIPEQGNKLLVTMGGSDPEEVTIKVVKGLKNLENDIQVKVVGGPSCVFFQKLKDFEKEGNISIIQDTEEMAGLMEWADIGISAGGGTLAEMAYMGLPSIIIKTAENQYASILYEKYGASLYLGDADKVSEEEISRCVKLLSWDPKKRLQMSGNGRKLLDGKGGRRIFEYLKQ